MKRSRTPDHDGSPDYPSSSIPIGEGDGLGSKSSTASRENSNPPAKVIHLDPTVGTTGKHPVMKCSLPPHKQGLAFASYEEYEAHYSKVHTNRCLDCRKNFPSEHLLSLHIEECHDSFAVVKRERGEHTYSCFVPECERKCMTPQKRRMHMIDKHHFPRNYFFALTKEGIDGRRSLLIEGGHRRRSSSSFHGSPTTSRESRRQATISEASREANSSQHPKDSQSPKNPANPKEVNMKGQEKAERSGDKTQDQKENIDVKIDDLSGAMSALQFVPTSIRFGRGGSRAGFSKTC